MTACGGKEASKDVEAQEEEVEEPTAQPTEEPTEKPISEATEDPTSEVTEEYEEATKLAAEMPAELSDDIYDFQISIDGTVYQFPMWYSDFEALGWEYDGDNTETLSSNQYTLGQRWKKDGVSVYTRFANLSMNAVTFADRHLQN